MPWLVRCGISRNIVNGSGWRDGYTKWYCLGLATAPKQQDGRGHTNKVFSNLYRLSGRGTEAQTSLLGVHFAGFPIRYHVTNVEPQLSVQLKQPLSQVRIHWPAFLKWDLEWRSLEMRTYSNELDSQSARYFHLIPQVRQAKSSPHHHQKMPCLQPCRQALTPFLAYLPSCSSPSSSSLVLCQASGPRAGRKGLCLSLISFETINGTESWENLPRY